MNITIKTSREHSFSNKLDALRQQINYLDEELITLIARRMQIAKEIGLLKKASNVNVIQTARYLEVVERALIKGRKVNLSEEFIKSLMDEIHKESIRTQNALRA